MDEKKQSSASTTTDAHKLFRKGTWVALSISPPPMHQHFHRHKTARELASADGYADRASTFFNTWLEWFQNNLSDNCTHYEMYMEISKNGLLHWHGKCCIKRPQSFAHTMGVLKYVNDIRIELDTISDMDVWDKYIKKDYPIMRAKITNKTVKRKGIYAFLSKDTSDSDEDN